MNCAIYARVSTDHGLNQQFNSIDSQIETCQHYIATYTERGWKHHKKHLYIDEALSGGTTERPALQRMLQAIKAGDVQVVDIYKIDRLSRNLRDFVEMQDLFAKHECSLASTTESFDTSTSMGRAMLNLVGVFAQLERERTRERILDKIAATKARGLWVGGIPPIGYETQDNKLIINKDTANTVRLIFKLRAEGKYPQIITQHLREQGILYYTKRVGEKPWTSPRVANVLKCPPTQATSPIKDKLYEGVHEAIIERKQWLKVQKLISEEARKRKALKEQPEYPLRGLLHCAQCGNKFIPSHTKSKGVLRRYYICQTKQKEGRGVCNCPNLNAIQAEEHLMRELHILAQDENILEALYAQLPEYKPELLGDCFYNIELLLDRLSCEDLNKLFAQTYERIEFSPEQSAFLLTKRKP